MTKPVKLGLDLQGGMRLILEAKDSSTVTVDDDAVNGVLDVLVNRINGLGVAEPIVRRKGTRQIVVELAGIKDPDRARAMIGKTALLEFVEAQWVPGNPEDITSEQLAVLGGPNARFAKFESRTGQFESIILQDVVLTGADLKFASPSTDDRGNPVVNIEFNANGGERFYEVTKRLTGRPLAILLDGRIISAPRVNEPIMGGRAVISGQFSIQEIKDLVVQLKAGALPVPVEIISETIVGPTLGSESITKSKKAGLIGMACLAVFMIGFYRWAGLMAVLALGIYGLYAFAILCAVEATLTLPGIAGFILTIGMAVDANVIIFERINEERSIGQPILASIKAGFSRAFLTIVDANVTTLVAAGVLFLLGSGTIKGFAVTLSIGILVSMFTALVVTQVFLDWSGRRMGHIEGLVFKRVKA